MRRGILWEGQPAGKSGWIFIRKHKKIDGGEKKKEEIPNENKFKERHSHIKKNSLYTVLKKDNKQQLISAPASG